MNSAARTVLCILIAAGLKAGPPAYAGNLTPPPGPIQPTDQVLINSQSGSIPVTISASGSYRLTSDLTGVAGQHGIVITADDVTLDLNGFTLRGVPGSNSGIITPGTQSRVRISNGVLQDWDGSGIQLGNSDHCVVTGVTIARSGDAGIDVGEDASVIGCEVQDSSGHGIDSGDRAIIRDCHASGNLSNGINTGNSSIVSTCVASLNGGTGIAAIEDARIIACVARGNLTLGIRATNASVISETTASYSPIGFDVNGAVSLTSCTAHICSDFGFLIGGASVVTNCTVRDSDGVAFTCGDGTKFQSCNVQNCGLTAFLIGGRCFIEGCLATGSDYGLRALGTHNRIVGNHFTNNNRGIEVMTAHNYIAGNTVFDNGDNYRFEPLNSLNLEISEIPETLDWPCLATVVGNLTGGGAGGSNGIQITSSHVTVDLGGHTLLGTGDVSETGIAIMGTLENIVVRNGTIRGWPARGVDLGAGVACNVENVTAIENGSDGIAVGVGSVISRCRAYDNGGIGIFAIDSVVAHSSALSNDGAANLVAAGSSVTDSNVAP